MMFLKKIFAVSVGVLMVFGLPMYAFAQSDETNGADNLSFDVESFLENLQEVLVSAGIDVVFTRNEDEDNGNDEDEDDEDDTPETDEADTDGDGFISVAEGVPFYGEIVNSLTVSGGASADSALALERFPSADENGEYEYSRTFTLSEVVDDLTEGELVLHGIDINGNGEYDGEKESSIAEGVPFEATVPAACGEIELESGNTFTANITELNSSGANAEADIELNGDQVTITFTAEEMSPSIAHAQHIHYVTDGDSVCPPNTVGVDQDMEDDNGENGDENNDEDDEGDNEDGENGDDGNDGENGNNNPSSDRFEEIQDRVDSIRARVNERVEEIRNRFES